MTKFVKTYHFGISFYLINIFQNTKLISIILYDLKGRFVKIFSILLLNVTFSSRYNEQNEKAENKSCSPWKCSLETYIQIFSSFSFHWNNIAVGLKKNIKISFSILNKWNHICKTFVRFKANKGYIKVKGLKWFLKIPGWQREPKAIWLFKCTLKAPFHVFFFLSY